MTPRFCLAFAVSSAVADLGTHLLFGWGLEPVVAVAGVLMTLTFPAETRVLAGEELC